jgi:hypothetical protein
VFVVLGVRSALRLAQLARLPARLQRLMQENDVRIGAAQRDCTDSLAHVRTIEVETDAASQPVNALLGKAGIRAADTGLRTIVAVLNAGKQHVVDVVVHIGMG